MKPAAALICVLLAAACTSTPPHRSAGGPHVAARLAIAARGGMLLQTFDGGGRPVGAPQRVGPDEPCSVPSWSANGRYLVWGTRHHPDDNSDLVVYDTERRKIHLEIGAGCGGTFRATTGGAVEVMGASDSGYDWLDLIGMHGDNGQRGAGSHHKAVGNEAIVGQRSMVVWAANGDLWLDPWRGPNHRLTLLGRQSHPPGLWLGESASSADGSRAAIVETETTSRTCLADRYVFIVDLRQRTVRQLPLPKGSTKLLELAYSSDRILGAIATRCDQVRPATGTFVELHGRRWVVAARGVSVGARGPNGLLAEQRGTVDDGTRLLRVRDSNGTQTAELPSARSVAWTAST